MSSWQVIIPEATTNYCTNPSFRVNITDGWTLTDADASVTATRNAIYAKFGAYSLKLINTDAGDNDFMYHRIAGLTANTKYTVTAWTYVATFTAGAQSDRGLYAYDTADAGTGQGQTITAATTGWVRKEVTVTMSAAPGSLEIRLYSPQGTIYWDAIQAEQKNDYSTTYCDGNQPGCWWNTAPENGTSSL